MTRRRVARLSVERPAAHLYVEGIRHFLGRWDTEREATIARARAILHFGVKRRDRIGERARRLGPASPEELRRLSRTTYKAATATSRFHGVSLDRKRGAFCAQVRHERKPITIGFFNDENEAATAVDRVSAFLGLAHRNFPRRHVRAASADDLRRELRANPRSSLRAVRKSETSSRFAGVIYDGENARRPWVVYFFSAASAVHTYVASFESERDAAFAHDRLALHYHARPVLNFPSRARVLGPASVEEIRAEAMHERKERTTSRYRGVYRTRRGQWAASIMHARTEYWLGLHDVEEAAAHAYDDAAWKLKGDHARVNFPTRRPKNARVRSAGRSAAQGGNTNRSARRGGPAKS